MTRGSLAGRLLARCGRVMNDTGAEFEELTVFEKHGTRGYKIPLPGIRMKTLCFGERKRTRIRHGTVQQ